jgi:hypothetical protein
LRGSGRDLALAPNPSPLSFREPSPDAEFLAVDDGELQAIGTYCALPADLFRRPRRCASFREEQVGIGAATIGQVLPREINVKSFDELVKHEVSSSHDTRVITGM